MSFGASLGVCDDELDELSGAVWVLRAPSQETRGEYFFDEFNGVARREAVFCLVIEGGVEYFCGQDEYSVSNTVVGCYFDAFWDQCVGVGELEHGGGQGGFESCDVCSVLRCWDHVDERAAMLGGVFSSPCQGQGAAFAWVQGGGVKWGDVGVLKFNGLAKGFDGEELKSGVFIGGEGEEVEQSVGEVDGLRGFGGFCPDDGELRHEEGF